MAKATAKYSPPIKQDVQLNEETPVTEQVNDVVEGQAAPEVVEAPVEELNQAPGVEELGTQDVDTQGPIEAPVTELEDVVTQGPIEAPVTELEPETPIAKEPVPIVASVVATVVKSEAQEQTELDKLIAKVNAEGNPYRKGIVHTLNAYCDVMKPGKVVEPAIGARQHFQLWHGILSIIDNCPDEEFRSTWNLVLAYFNLNQNSALNDRYIFRFMHEWAQGNDQCKAYQHIINLIKLTMDPKHRATGLKQVSLERSLTEVISEAGRSKLVAFYQA